MRIEQRADEAIEISDLDAITTGLLRGIPAATRPDDPRAERRLFSSPTGGTEPEFDEEWRELVEPDLRHLFLSAVETIQEDLAPLLETTNGTEAKVVIPSIHFDAWLNGLNQARLAIAARHGLDEADDVDRPSKTHPGDPADDFARFQIHFYGLIQEFLIRLTEVDDE